MRVPDQMPPIPIKLKAVAAELHLGLRALAKATGMGQTPIHRLLNTGAWPVRAKRGPIEQLLLQACRDAGATPAQMVDLFNPVVVFAVPEATAAPQPDSESVSNPVSATPTPEENPDMFRLKDPLTREAKEAFRLFQNPFDGEVTCAEEMFTNADFGACREACWQTINHGRFVAIIGESGAGKTTLLDDVMEMISSEGRQMIVAKPSVLGMDDKEPSGKPKPLKMSGIMDKLIRTLDPTVRPMQSNEDKTDQLTRLLEDSTKAGFRHLLLLEEAHRLPISTLKHLKGLHELRFQRKPLLGILLLGQPELRDKLNPGKYNIREISQRIEIVSLRPLDHDLKKYLSHRMKRVNRPLSDVMDDAAVDAIRARLTIAAPDTKGRPIKPISLVYPLTVNNFVTAALNTAAALGVPRVTRDVVLGV